MEAEIKADYPDIHVDYLDIHVKADYPDILSRLTIWISGYLCQG
jgi:hypothetical protein